MQHTAFTHKAVRHAKILVTLGPASSSIDIIRALVAAGASAFRLNFSHGSHDDHRAQFERVRQVEAEVGFPLAILQDLQGPKVRIGAMTAPTELQKGDTFTLDLDPTPGDHTRVHLPHDEIMPLLKEGDKIFINDGLVRLTVTEKYPHKAVCVVTAGGLINSHKGLNLPTLEVPMAALTPKDKSDLAFGLALGVDWVALSFVQRREDIDELKALVQGRARIMAKIEMPSAVKRLDDIIPLVDACMVARGDLGVELPLEEVPPIQKRIIRRCREEGKIVVVATQMLESMTQNSSPTRAEVSDVANAAYEGADVLMLSAESASGKYPVEAVATMDAVIRRVEQSSAWQPLVTARQLTNGKVEDAITNAAAGLAEAVKARAIVTFTSRGTTALRMSRQRPAQPILVLTPQASTARGLSLAWGVHTEVTPDIFDMEKMVLHAAEKSQSLGVASAGDYIVVTAGMPIGTPGSTNMVRVTQI